MKIRVFIKVFGKVLPLIIIPILLIIKLKWEAILPMIIYLQLLMIWARAEIGLRQHNLFLVEYDPHFDIKIEGKEIIPVGDPKIYEMCIYNIIKNPAYRINITRLRPTAADIYPTNFKTFIPCLPPEKKRCTLFSY